MGKKDFTDQEAHHLTLEIRLAKTPPEVYGDWKDNQLTVITITEILIGAREVFGELWTKDILTTEADSWNVKEDLESHNPFTPTKKLNFKEVESILKSPKHSRRKESESLKTYLKARYNVKPTKKRYKLCNMAFKTYLHLLLLIAIQQINEYGATETKNTGKNC